MTKACFDMTHIFISNNKVENYSNLYQPGIGHGMQINVCKKTENKKNAHSN